MRHQFVLCLAIIGSAALLMHAAEIHVSPVGSDAKHCEGEPGRQESDALYQSIKAQADGFGGWPGKPDLNAMIDRIQNCKDRYGLSSGEIRTMHKLII